VLDIYDLEMIKQLVVYTQNREMAGIGDLASPQYKQQTIMMNPNKRWEEYMFQQYCIGKASNGCYLFHFDGTYWFWTMILKQ
jgi:hypothetical protein